MKHAEFAVFLILALAVYAGINFLIYVKTRQALSGMGWMGTLLLVLLLLWMAAYPVGRILESISSGPLSQLIIHAGSIYLGVMTYAFLIILLLGAFWGVNRWIHFLPSWFSNHPHESLRWTTAVSALVIFVTILTGTINALHLRVRHFNVDVPSGSTPSETLRLVAVSDLHLGAVVGPSRLGRIVNAINKLQPDVVLFVGDLVDEDAFGSEAGDFTSLLRTVQARHGVYGVTGNHEYYAGLTKSIAFFKAAGITLLQDSAAVVADAFCLIGRKDFTAERMEDSRMPLQMLVSECGMKRPLVVMDHQPILLREAEENRVALQVSGHTHHGQLFPFNWITNAVYEKSWGWTERGETQVIVSCGTATWGPPVRTAGVSEIVEISLTIGK